MSLGLLIFSFGNTYLHAMIGLAFLGMTQGLAMTIGGTFWPNYYGTKNLGSVRSLSTSTMVFGTSLGPAIVGMLLDFGHNYILFIRMCILAIFASISLAITMKHTPKLISKNIKKEFNMLNIYLSEKYTLPGEEIINLCKNENLNIFFLQ